MEDISRDIIEEAQAGNIASFEKIYKDASGFVYSVAFRITNNRQEAQEVTQDVFIKIYNNLKDFRFKSSFKTWAYRITVNTAINAYNKMVKDSSRRQDLDTVINTQAAATDTRKELGQQEEISQRESRVRSLLSILNPDQRSAIILRDIQGLSYKEISAALNTNINTVRTRLKRAREALMAQSQGER